jgi:hypothetical protein
MEFDRKSASLNLHYTTILAAYENFVTDIGTTVPSSCNPCLCQASVVRVRSGERKLPRGKGVWFNGGL